MDEKQHKSAKLALGNPRPASEYYYPYGMVMDERNLVVNGSYRYAFNGQEVQSEITGSASHMSAEFWMYDTRIGRRWERDPISVLLPWFSPYGCFLNNPILYNDPLGLNAGDPVKVSVDGNYEDKNNESTLRSTLPSSADDGQEVTFEYSQGNTTSATWTYSKESDIWTCKISGNIGGGDFTSTLKKGYEGNEAWTMEAMAGYYGAEYKSDEACNIQFEKELAIQNELLRMEQQRKANSYSHSNEKKINNVINNTSDVVSAVSGGVNVAVYATRIENYTQRNISGAMHIEAVSSLRKVSNFLGNVCSVMDYVSAATNVYDGVNFVLDGELGKAGISASKAVVDVFMGIVKTNPLLGFAVDIGWTILSNNLGD